MVNNGENNMTQKHALQIALEAMLNQGEDIHVRSYSGRFMYGKECLAVTVDRGFNDHQLIALAVSQPGVDVKAITDALQDTRQDSMGLGTVLYWPNVPYVENEEVEE